MSDEEAGTARRRGRGCLLRVPVYLLLLLLALGTGLWMWGQSEGARDAARRMLEARLSEYFERDVRLGAVRWTVAPVTVELEDLVIPGPEADAAPPFAHVPVLRLQLGLEGWAGWGKPILHVEQVRLDSPEVHLRIHEDGSNNLPRFGRGADGGGGRLEVRLGSLVVEGGRFHLNEMALPLDLSARALVARLAGERADDGGLVLDGRATAQEVEITLPDGRPYLGTVSARTRIGPRVVEVTELHLRGPDLTVRAAGELIIPEEERRMNLSIVASGTVAVAERLGYLDSSVPLSGPFWFDGAARWQPDGWSVEGALDAERLVYDRRTITDVVGALRVVPDGLRYRIDRAEYADGTFSGLVRGELGVDNPVFHIDLKLEALALQALARDQDLPLEGIYGRVGGEVSYRFELAAPVAGSGWADLAVRGARTPETAEGLAVSGRVPLEIDRGVLRSSAIRLATPDGAQLLEAEGAVDLEAGTGRFEYRLSTLDVGPLFGLVPIEEGGAVEDGSAVRPPWMPTEGAGEAIGEFRIEPGTFSVTATFDLDDVRAPGLLADHLEGTVRLTPLGLDDLVVEASRGEGALMVLGAVPFEGEPGAAPPFAFHLSLDAASWPADERVAAWLPFELPAEGPISGHLELEGTPEALQGRARLEMAPAEVAGAQLDLVIAELRFAPDAVRVERLEARTGAGAVTARGTVGLESGAIDFQASAPDLNLDAEPFASLLQGDLSGHLVLEATAGGTLEAPRVEATVTGSDLVIAGHPVGEDGGARLDLDWDAGRLTLEGGVPGVLRLDGGGDLTTERADLAIRVASERLGDAIRAVAPKVPEGLRGEVSGELAVAGPLASPEELLIRFSAPDLTLHYEDRTLEVVEPVVVRYTGEAVEIDSFFVQETGTSSELFVQGSIGLDGEQPLDLRTQSSISTDWVELFAPELEIDGSFELLATVGGTLSEPAVNGQGELRDGHVIIPGFPQSFEEVQALVLFYPREVVLDELRADVGGGDLRAFGRLEPYAEEGIDYRLQATMDGITLRFQEGFWFRADAALTLLQTPDGRLVRGTITLDRAYYVQDVETSLVQILRRALRTERLEVAETDELAASTQLALSVQAPGTIRVRNNLADLRGSADLTVRGNAARPVIFGTVEFESGGTLVYEDTRFEVERARLTFANPAQIEPVIDLVAQAEIREYDVTLDLSGKLDNLQVGVASDPPLSDLDVVSLLATGQAPSRTGLGAAGAREDSFSASGFLAGQAAAAVTERVGTLFGFDRFRITPSEGGAGGAGVTVGKRLSKDVSVSYTERSATSEESLLRVEWQVDENLTLVFSSGEQNAFRVDARWNRRF